MAFLVLWIILALAAYAIGELGTFMAVILAAICLATVPIAAKTDNQTDDMV